jgi:hypothetical protein
VSKEFLPSKQVTSGLSDLLFGNVLELSRSFSEVLADLVGKSDHRDEVAQAEAKAHFRL